jgi:Ca-activated chloride channel family protein
VAVTWRDDDLLWLLLLVPALSVLPFLAARLRTRATARFGSVAGQLTVGRPGALRIARAVLLLSTITLAILALAGPRYGSRTRLLRQRGLDLVIALDFSKSMLAQDVTPSRIERAKAELQGLIQGLDGDRVGIVAFAGETIQFPMTADAAALNLFVRDLGPYDMPVGGTAIARAMVAGRELLDRAARPLEEGEEGPDRVLILLTDGEDHEGDPVEVAEELADAGVRVYTVGIGSRSGEPIPTYAEDGTWLGWMRDREDHIVTTSFTEENEATLRRVAEITGGQFFRAPEGDVGIAQIQAELDRLQREEREARRVTVHEPRFALLLFPAFLLLVLEALLPEAWVGRRRAVPAPPRKKRRRLA